MGTTSSLLFAFLALLALQRLGELWLSARNLRILRPRGAVEYGRRHFPLFVVLHTLYPLALAAEVLVLGSRPGRAWPWFLVLFLLAQGLRLWSVRALGKHWNVRIWVVPGTP